MGDQSVDPITFPIISLLPLTLYVRLILQSSRTHPLQFHILLGFLNSNIPSPLTPLCHMSNSLNLACSNHLSLSLTSLLRHPSPPPIPPLHDPAHKTISPAKTPYKPFLRHTHARATP